jgi:hypothetical protein
MGGLPHPGQGFGIHAYAHKITQPIRLTDEELRAHDEWRNFGPEIDNHPPMRGWLAVPLVGSDGVNYGFIQASDRLEAEFTEQDEANLVRAGGAHVDGARRAGPASSARLSAQGCRAVVRLTSGALQIDFWSVVPEVPASSADLRLLESAVLGGHRDHDDLRLLESGVLGGHFKAQ